MREGWAEHRVADLLERSIGGVWGKGPGEADVDVAVARSTEFRNDGRLDLSTAVTRSITRRELESRQLRPGDILLEKSGGGPHQPVGRVVQVQELSDRPLVCSNFIQMIRPNQQLVDPTFLFLVLWNWHSRGDTLGFQSRTTGIRNLRTKDYLQQPVLIPLPIEQQRIVDLIAAVTRLNDTVTATVSANDLLLIHATESLFDDLARNADHRPIGQMLHRARRPITVDASRPYRQIGIRSHAKGIFHKEPVLGAELGNKRVFWIEPDDLVFNIVFAWEGAVAVAKEAEKGMCGSHRFPTYTDAVEGAARYLRHFFRTALGKRMLNEASPGSAGRNRTLNQSLLLSFAIPMPQSSDLRETVNVLDAIETTAARARAYQGAVSALRLALLTRLLSGEHEIPVTYDALLETV